MNINLSRKGIALLEFSEGVVTAQEAIALQVIQTMVAAHNKISVIRGVRMFVSLVTLDLSHNRLTSPVSGWLSELPKSLKTLNLAHNEIASFGDGSMCRGFVRLLADYVPNLVSLDLSSNLLHISSSKWDTDSDDSVMETDASPPRHALRELDISNNTGVFSLQAIVRGLFALEILSCEGNHIESLEELAPVASVCPSLQSINLEGNEIFDKLTSVHFLWSLIGGDDLCRADGSDPALLQRDVSELSPQFFAALISEVIPQLETVNGVRAVESWELVGHLLDGVRADPSHEAQQPPRSDSPTSILHTASHRTNDVSTVIELTPEKDKAYSDETEDSDHERTGDFEESEEENEESGVQPKPLSFDLSKQFAHVMRAVPLTPSQTSEVRPVDYTSNALDQLHQKAAELQRFIAESQARSRDLEDLAKQATTDIRSQRRFISQQLAEMAALRLERTSQRESLIKMERVLKKRTLELSHAEVANLRVEEKKLTAPLQAKQKEENKRQLRVKREKLLQQSLQGPAHSTSGRPTRTSLMIMEETQRKLASLKQSSPTAMLGTRFAYDEYGNPSFVGSSEDAEYFPPSAHGDEHPNDHLHEGFSPRRTSKRLSFQTTATITMEEDELQSPHPPPNLAGPPQETVQQVVQRRRSTIQEAQTVAEVARRQSLQMQNGATQSPSRDRQPQNMKGRALSLGSAQVAASDAGKLRRATQPDFASMLTSANITVLDEHQQHETADHEPIRGEQMDETLEGDSSQLTTFTFPADADVSVIPTGHSDHGSVIQPALLEDTDDEEDGTVDVVLQSPVKRQSEFTETGGQGLRRPSKPSEAILALASNEARAQISKKQWETKSWEDEQTKRTEVALSRDERAYPPRRNDGGMTSVGRAAVVPEAHRYNLALGQSISKQKPNFRQS